MKRRQLMFGGGAVVLSAIARAQTPRRYRLGLFQRGGPENLFAGNLQLIFDELGRLGYVRSTRLEVHERFATKREEAEPFARELAAMPLDAILTEGVIFTLAAQGATRTMPIVTIVGDPVAEGFAKTLQKPGGNITGMAQNIAGRARKQIELLRLLRPRTVELAVPSGAKDPSVVHFMDAMAEAAVEAGIRVRRFVRRFGDGVARMFEELERSRIDTVVLINITPEQAQIAIRHRIAVIGPDVGAVEKGGVLIGATSGLSPGDYVRVARIIDKIFTGQKPADIPFELDSRFIIAVNAKAAAALGIRLTPEVFLRVDRVFE
jgi:putative ABC transport system substrate-binding protein